MVQSYAAVGVYDSYVVIELVTLIYKKSDVTGEMSSDWRVCGTVNGGYTPAARSAGEGS